MATRPIIFAVGRYYRTWSGATARLVEIRNTGLRARNPETWRPAGPALKILVFETIEGNAPLRFACNGDGGYGVNERHAFDLVAEVSEPRRAAA